MINAKDGKLIIQGIMEIYEDIAVPDAPVVMVTIGNHHTIGKEIADYVGYKESGVHKLVATGKKKWRLTLELIDEGNYG